MSLRCAATIWARFGPPSTWKAMLPIPRSTSLRWAYSPAPTPSSRGVLRTAIDGNDPLQAGPRSRSPSGSVSHEGFAQIRLLQLLHRNEQSCTSDDHYCDNPRGVAHAEGYTAYFV